MRLVANERCISTYRNRDMCLHAASQGLGEIARYSRGANPTCRFLQSSIEGHFSGSHDAIATYLDIFNIARRFP